MRRFAAALVFCASCASQPPAPPEEPAPVAKTAPASSPTARTSARAAPSSPLDTPMVGVLAGIVSQAPNPDADSGEWLGSAPNVKADVAAFEIDERAASRADYARCVQAGACTAPGDAAHHPGCAEPRGPDAPVGCIDQAQARAFCTWANKRLPTELEVMRAEMTLRERRPKRDRDAKEWTSTAARWKEWPEDPAVVVAHAAPRWSRRGQRPSARQPALGVRCVRSKEPPPESAVVSVAPQPVLPADAVGKYTAIFLEQLQRANRMTPAQLEKQVSVTSSSFRGTDAVDLKLTLRLSAGWFVLDGLEVTLPVSLDCASRSSAAPCDAWLERDDYETLKSEGAAIGRRFKLAPVAFRSEAAAQAALERRFGPLTSALARGIDEDGRPWLCGLVRDPENPDSAIVAGIDLITAKPGACTAVEIPGQLPWSR